MSDTLPVIQTCPLCGEKTLEVKIQDEIFEFQGSTLTLPLKICSCSSCGESFYDADELERLSPVFKRWIEFAKAVREATGWFSTTKVKEI